MPLTNHLPSHSSAPVQDEGFRMPSLQSGCPACGSAASPEHLESFHSYRLYACPSCRLHFWEPRSMPSAQKCARMFADRDVRLLPLEPGHLYFLRDARAPGAGTLLDAGCGTGNFLTAAWNAGYSVTGVELDPEAARFAAHLCGHARVHALSLERFVERNPQERFDVVTFFEVLEHQADPSSFLRAALSALRPGGYIALSVPNRERWLTGIDPIDYPPNHFLRWNPFSLRFFLEAHGLQVLSLREQPAGLAYTAQMLNIALRSGISAAVVPDLPPSFRDAIQDDCPAPESAPAPPSLRFRIVHALARVKFAACFSLALLAMPYVRWKRYRGAYLYSLARKAAS